MTGRLLPDTNAVIALFAGDPRVVREFQMAGEVFASSTVLGELYYGARHSARALVNVARVDAFVAGSVVLECNLETSRQYGLVKAALRAKGRMIPDNDLWIASLALQHGLELLTNDAHFGEVDGLASNGW